MKQTTEIKAVGLVRRIRDDQAKQLAKKSATEVMDFFNRAGERAKKRGNKFRRIPESAKASDPALQPTPAKSGGRG